MTVASPCTGQCRLDARGLACTGCLRAMAEIAQWPVMTEDERRACLACLPARKKAVLF